MAAALLLAFLYRLGFGLCSEFWNNADNQQIYLLGLKFYATGMWPYFGPTVTPTIQIPGALQGMLAGLPFHLVPIPEAPFVLVALLSFTTISFLAWYSTRRFPAVPGWLIWSWLFTLPWTLNVSNSTYNPSYVLTGSVLFFVGALEIYPFTTLRVISANLSMFMMGLGISWIMQLHLSWVLLLPYALLAIYFPLRRHTYSSILYFAVGLLLPAILLLPTVIRYGFAASVGDTSASVEFNLRNALAALNPVEGIVPRFLSFASYEIPRFLGHNTATRIAFIKDLPWLAPVVAALLIVGILQPISLVWRWFSSQHRHPQWQAMRYLTLGTILLICIAFLFSIKSPAAHTFYLTLPLSLLYALSSWEQMLTKIKWQRVAVVLIVASIVLHAGIAFRNFRSNSIYVDRNRIGESLRKKDYHLVGERPAGSKY